MPAQSKSQQRFFGVVKAMQKGDIPKKGRAGKIAKSMSKDDVDDFASTKHKGKPEKVKREQRVRNLIKKMVREELAKMNEVKIPFSSSHIKQLKRAFKDMKGTLPDNNPLVQQIVTLLKKTDKKVLKQIASADIKYLSDKAKDILGEEKITEAMDSYVVWSPLLNKVYDGPVSEKKALMLIKKYAKQGQYHVGMLGTKYFNKTKLGKKNPVKEGKLNEGKTLTLPNGVKVKLDFKGVTFISRTSKPVFLDRGELHRFFKATTKYLRYT